MEHVVFFPAQDGTPAFRRFAGLEDAVRFVEHLRNVENVAGASVYSLTEIPLAFKAWYRVELPAGAEQEVNSSEAPAAVAAAEAAPAEAAPAEAPAEPAAPAAFVPAAPATMAETIQSYTNGAFGSVSLPEAGSATGIVVPDQPLVAVDQFTAPPVPIVPLAPQAPFVDAPAAVAASSSDIEPDAQVLEPTFGARRERGLGFFAH